MIKNRSVIFSIIAILLIANSVLFIFPANVITYAANEETVNNEATQELPSEYCMRDEYIVLAQNQDSHGYCWNFAATMSASTTLMKATGEYYDFSELWTGISLNTCTKDHGKIGRGGSFNNQYDAMKQSGLMLESDLPYQYSYTASDENAEDYYNFYEKYSNDDLASCLVYDKSMYYSKTEIEEIKSHIYNHGSIYLTFTFRSGYVEDGGASYLPPNQTNTNSNHAVSVIGWDDNFEREFYLDGSSTPTVFKGAWIILNSYTEKSGNDGISFVFYDDNNIGSIQGYKYEMNTAKDLYFYDKIESGYNYITNLKGRYYGDFSPEQGLTKQKNIFYDNVDLEYSYVISNNASISEIEIYLDGQNVTNDFDISIDHDKKRFNISKNDAAYGQYKVLVTYGNGQKSDTYLNNFFVTYGLVGEEIEYDYDNNSLAFNTGRDLEYYSFISSDKNYVIYTNQLTGEIKFLPTETSVYSEKNMSVPSIVYSITNGESCTATHKVKSDLGYELEYNFVFEYYEDTTLQPVNVYYDLGGGVNHNKNYSKELASSSSDLMLYAPEREGYTFDGWYLDYGNGSKKVSEVDGVYYISWDDIHHLGEAPGIHALGNYNRYYNNSNTVFVYAHWKEIDYYNVDLSIVGEGSSQITEEICIGSEDCVRYIFKPKSGWCLTEVKLNDIEVSKDELLEIAKFGLQIKNIDQDISITATFSEGTYLSLKYGENVKNAYVIGTLEGVSKNFYDGDFIPDAYFNDFGDRFNPIKTDKDVPDLIVGADIPIDTKLPGLVFPGLGTEFTLVVELYEDGDGYTYVLDNESSYTFKNGLYQKKIMIKGSDSIKEINVGSATKKVKITYSVNDQILDHYISTDANANNGEKNVGIYDEGQTVYLFIKIPSDTVVNHYCVPEGFESVGDQWYRMTVTASISGATMGELKVEQELQQYTVTWKNWDGSVIYTEKYSYGQTPVFNHKESVSPNTPVRPSDKVYKYSFKDWEDPIEAVKGDVTYIATYTSEFVQYTVSVETTENGCITPEGNNTITNLDEHTYIFTPSFGYQVKDVIVNGESLGPLLYYTFSNVCENQTLKVEFEKIKHPITVICGENGSADISGVVYVEHGEDVTVNISPDRLFAIDFVKFNGVCVDAAESLTFENIEGDALIEIAFTQIEFNIVTSSIGKGAVTPTSIVRLNESTRVDFVPETWYKIKNVTIDGVSVGAIEYYTFVNVNNNHLVYVEYEINSLLIVAVSISGVLLVAAAVFVPIVIKKRKNLNKN